MGPLKKVSSDKNQFQPDNCFRLSIHFSRSQKDCWLKCNCLDKTRVKVEFPDPQRFLRFLSHKEVIFLAPTMKPWKTGFYMALRSFCWWGATVGGRWEGRGLAGHIALGKDFFVWQGLFCLANLIIKYKQPLLRTGPCKDFLPASWEGKKAMQRTLFLFCDILEGSSEGLLPKNSFAFSFTRPTGQMLYGV